MTAAPESGTPVVAPPRADVEPIPAGAETFAPPAASELLHAVVLRPPRLLWDGLAYTGSQLGSLDALAAERTPGVVRVVVRRNFIGIIASQPGQAQQARARLHPQWAAPLDTAPTGTALDASAGFVRTYQWRSDAVAAANWAVAHFTGRELRVWARTRQPRLLRAELAQLCALDVADVRLFPGDQSQGDNYDAAADAAVLSMACGKPVRVQDDGGAWETESPIRLTLSATLADAPAASSPDGAALSFSGAALQADRPAGRRLSMAALLCGAQGPERALVAIQEPSYLPLQVGRPAAAPLSEIGSSLDGLPAAAQVFAQESFFDELCRDQRVDPVRARLAALQDARGKALVASVANRAQWFAGPEHCADQKSRRDAGMPAGRGFAYAHVIDRSQEPPRQVWSAWVADVLVDRRTGQVSLTRLTVGHDASEAPRSPQDTAALADRARRAAAQCLPYEDSYDRWGASDAADPVFPLGAAHAAVDLVEESGPLGLAWGPHAELPAAAAIANAIQDATGVRVRQLPLDAGALRAQLMPAAPRRARKAAWAMAGGVAAALGAALLSAMPWRGAIAPVVVDTSVYSAAAIERGRLVAAAGDCMVCHTAKGGAPNAGGLALETPFGAVYSSNITPDRDTGIGAWSFAAFDRAMRQGIHRDGRHLYPAFPYTSFAKLSEADMQGLYAYLMTRDPVSHVAPETNLPFPYGVRPLLAGWNLLFHDSRPYQADPEQSTLWNRGAYLVQGAGHCAACHSPRNALGAEKSGVADFLAGGEAEGWEAPPLNALSKAPIPWSEAELYRYLRTGYSPLHGAAAGPMGPVVHSMAAMPDADVRAMAHYLAGFARPDGDGVKPALRAARLEDRSRSDLRVQSLAGENLFEGACAVCHDARGGPPLFGARPSLALNSSVHSDRPDNVIQVLLRGIPEPAAPGLGYMPGFGDSLNDEQLTELLRYLRQRFAPDQPAWDGLPQAVRAARGEAGP